MLCDRLGQVGLGTDSRFGHELHPRVNIVARPAELLDGMRDAGWMRRLDPGPPVAYRTRASQGHAGRSDCEGAEGGTRKETAAAHANRTVHEIFLCPVANAPQHMRGASGYRAERVTHSIDRAKRILMDGAYDT